MENNNSNFAEKVEILQGKLQAIVNRGDKKEFTKLTQLTLLTLADKEEQKAFFEKMEGEFFPEFIQEFKIIVKMKKDLSLELAEDNDFVEQIEKKVTEKKILNSETNKKNNSS